MSRRAKFKLPTRDPDRPRVPALRDLIQSFYSEPGNGAGGVLHVVLDDGNIRDSDICAALENARAVGNRLAEQIAESMLRMTPTQRRKLL